MNMEFSLGRFNERILHTGEISPFDSINSLFKKFTFNKIFYNNMQEIFYKMDWSSIKGLYSYLLKEFNKNMDMICDRLDMDFDTKIPLKFNKMIETRIPVNKLHAYPFKKGLTYINIRSGTAILNYADMKRSKEYNQYLFLSKKYGLKIDALIKNSLNERYKTDTYIVKASFDNAEKLVKLEYSDEKLLKKMKGGFLCFSCLNRYPFIDDIEVALKSNPEYRPALDYKPNRCKYLDMDDVLEKDLLFQYPYDSFDDYLHFLENAAEDPRVETIMMTIYRIGNDPTITELLKRALANKKKVYINVELRASNEFINMDWVKFMKRIGAKVNHYSYKRLKVHAKLTLVKFKDGRAVAQIGTGNYHTKTAYLYSDFSLYTIDENICREVEEALLRVNEIGGRIPIQRKLEFDSDLLVTRVNFRNEFKRLAESQSHRGGFIAIKCNSFDDKISQEILTSAARKGCKVNLIVRGVCTWEPKHPNIHIKSIIWDVLEHSRVYIFGAKDPEVYLGSLDLTKKKIDERVEVMVRLTDKNTKRKLCNILLEQLRDLKNSWVLGKKTYHRAKILEGFLPPE